VEYRQLGKSGCVVSGYALGTMTFGQETDQDDAFAQLDLYAEAGGNLIDTADVYAGGASETIVGQWFRSRPREVTEQQVVITKGRFPTGAGPNDLGLSRRHLSRALDASLRRLQLDRVDMYMVHAYDPLTPLEETLGFLDDAVRAGKIDYVGLSNFAAWQLQRAADVAEFTRLSAPVALQVQYSLLARDVEWEILPAAAANGIGVLPWSPLGGGWLTGKYGRERPVGATRLGEDPNRGVEAYDRRSSQQRTWDVLDALGAVATARKVSVAAVALTWLAARPAVTSITLGARTATQLKDNLQAVDLTLTADEIASLDRASDPGVGDNPYGAMGLDQRNRVLPSAG
jgi:aryl-alcohol dehydrogenase-like predicted oxidoreductase